MKARARRVAPGGSGEPPSRAALAARLRERREEINEAVLARAYGVADPTQVADPAYLLGLRAAISAAVEYGLSTIEDPSAQERPIPAALIVQARIAARNGILLEAVLRRYSAGHSLLLDALLEETVTAGIATADLKPALRSLAAQYDRIVVAVGEEYRRERDSAARDPEARRTDLLRRLLAGELLDLSGLGYDLDAQHLAIHACGPAREKLAEVAKRLDRRLLLAEPAPGMCWAWLGGRRDFLPEDLDFVTSYGWPEPLRLACGEPGTGPAGWRLSHRQAAAALPVAQRAAEAFVRYADVALLAATLQDDLLATWLHRSYLTPLESGREEGAPAKATLRAYFRAGRNVSSTAAVLGINRRTVATRLAAVEERLGRPLDAIATELEVALSFDDLEDPTLRGR